MNEYVPRLSKVALRWVRFGAVLLAILVLAAVVFRLRAVFTPLLAAFALAYIFNPVVSWLERRGVRRLLSVVALYIVGLVVLVAGLLFLGSLTVAQISELKSNIGPILARLGDMIAVIDRNMERLAEYLPGAATTAPATQPDLTATAPTSSPIASATWWPTASAMLETHGRTAAASALEFVTRVAGDVPALAALFVLIPMYGFFFLWRFNDIVTALRTHLPAKSRDTVVDVFDTINSSTANFFRGRLIVCFVVGTLTGIGWQLVGVKFGLLLGLLAGLFNLVPFLSTLVLPVAVLFAYLSATEFSAATSATGQAAAGAWFWPVVLTLAVSLTVQAIESFLLSPVIESRTSGLHPITTVVALLIGADVAGLLGMLLAIPAASTLKTLSVRWVLPEIRRLAGMPVAEPVLAVPEPAGGASETALPGLVPAGEVPPSAKSGGSAQ